MTDRSAFSGRLPDDDLDGMVRFAGEAVVDARPVHDQPDLDDPLPDHPHQLRVRLREGAPRKLAGKVALPFAVNLVANLLFMPIFAGLRNVPLAAADIVIVWATLVWCVVAVWPYYRWVAVAQVPYFVWVSIATVLQLSITAMNW